MNSLEISSLEFGYMTGPSVLEVGSFKVSRGERVFLYGPSGCGKTTLLGLITGVLTPRTGNIKILDTDLTKLSMHSRDLFRGAHIGYVFQVFNLLPYLTVSENIALPCKLNKTRAERLNGKSIGRVIDKLAGDLGISHLLNKPVHDLSVGQQQRVAVARAFLGNPELIVADEPTSALDSDHKDKFIDLLISEASEYKSTVLFVSHDRSLASHFDREVSLPSLNKVVINASA